MILNHISPKKLVAFFLLHFIDDRDDLAEPRFLSTLSVEVLSPFLSLNIVFGSGPERCSVNGAKYHVLRVDADAPLQAAFRTKMMNRVVKPCHYNPEKTT